MRNISELSILLKVPEDELVRTLLRLAGRSQLTVRHLAELLIDAGVKERLRLAEEDVKILAMAAGCRLDRIAAKG